jgi:hypothetical protein
MIRYTTGQNCELMDPSSDLIALWKNNLKSVGSWRDPCSTGQNCELMDPSSDLIALWKNNSSKSSSILTSSTGQFIVLKLSLVPTEELGYG